MVLSVVKVVKVSSREASVNNWAMPVVDQKTVL